MEITMKFAAKAAEACKANKITDPEAEITALTEFAAAAEDHRDALLAHDNNMARARAFAASHSYDDPAHHEHQQVCAGSRLLLNDTQVELDTCLIRLHSVRGQVSPQASEKKERIATARSIVAAAAPPDLPRFIRQPSTAAVIQDTQHRLMWVGCNLCGGKTVSEDKHKAAIAQLNVEEFGGFSDWDMPEVEELETLYNRKVFKPATHTEFFGFLKHDDWYRTKTPDASDPACAWFVHFNFGSALIGPRFNPGYALAVRRVAALPGQ